MDEGTLDLLLPERELLARLLRPLFRVITPSYSAPVEVEARLATIVAEFCSVLPAVATRATVPFNRMDEWGADGRIKPGAPVFSPYIRRKPTLEIE